MKETAEILATKKSWSDFYKTHYGLDFDFSEVFIPPEPSRPHLLAIIAKGLTCSQVYDALPFKKGRYLNCNFDHLTAKNDRDTTNGHYAAWLWPGYSTDMGGPGDYYESEKVDITLLERLILEHKYFIETGKHLASINCLGSRDAQDSPCSVYVIRYGEFKGQFMVSGNYDMNSLP